MQHILLLGAGFSRNWGGWLASEAFEYLLGCPEISGNQYLRDLLWKNQTKGGFEGALSELQRGDLESNLESKKKYLNDLQYAVRRMFDDMNNGFFAHESTFRKDVYSVGPFLAKFDAVFTLNQDLLLERYYFGSNYSQGKWSGKPELPGMLRKEEQYRDIEHSWAKFNYEPDDSCNFKIDKNNQPYFKLHGSSNWRNPNGGSLLIMGGTKAQEIGLSPILKWYYEQFEEHLFQSNTSLMVIGYGFRDDHINDTITQAVKNGLKMFIIAPEGPELAMKLNPLRHERKSVLSSKLEHTFQQSLIGASRRSLREIFGSDTIEHNKVMRFFQD